MRISQLVVSSSVLLAAAVAHANPSVDGSDPSVFVADVPGSPQQHTVTMWGAGLNLPSTSGYTFDTDVQVYARAPGHDWQRAVTGGWAHVTGWSAYELAVTVDGFEAPGTLQFQICVRGTGCMTSYFTATIRARTTLAPQLYEPNGQTYTPFTSSVGPSDSRRQTYFSAWGLNDAASTCIYIDGGGGGYVSLGLVDAGDGYGYFWMPNLATGDHRIWISNAGCWGGHWSTYNWIHVAFDWGGPPPI
jgi:hypothetical protein